MQGVILIGAIGLILIVSLSVPEPKGPSPRKIIARHLLTDADPRALGIEGLASEIKEMKRSQEDLLSRMKNFEDHNRETPNPQTPPASEPELRTMKEEMDRLRGDLENLRDSKAPEAQGTTDRDSIFPDANLHSPEKTPTSRDIEAWIPSIHQKSQNNDAARPQGTIRVLKNSPAANATLPHEVQSGAHLFIPAGTLLSGNLLNDLDAPTGTHARKEPYPVLVRLKELAILPNRYRADLRECFLIGSGYGDLSAERAYVRAEAFSCIRRDRRVIEVPIDAYAVGEDGKLGLRGRVIDKQGQMMAESLMAGFANGFSSLFGRVQIPVIMTGGQNALSSNVPYQNVFSQQATEGALMKGTGSALDRISNYYMDLAENLFPVIEIDATRKIEFVVQRGFEMNPNPARTPSNQTPPRDLPLQNPP